MTHPVLVAALGSTDLLALAVVLLLLAVSSFLALAETGLTRVSRARAAAFAEEWGRKGRTIARLVSKPERWFCTEEDAQAAGFRKAYNCQQASDRGRM